jgi:hypothetical protein
MDKSLLEWESRRKKGITRFILGWGVLRLGSAFLLVSVVSMSFTLMVSRRPLVVLSRLKGGIIGFVLFLILLSYGCGALVAAIEWVSKELSRWRTNRRPADA